MSAPGEWLRRARYLLNRRRQEDDLRREMEAHRELMAAPARFLRDAGGTERVMVVRTERDFFAVLAVPALYGRTYDSTDATATVVIGETFWKSRLGGAADIIGRALILDGQPYTVTGIMPAG